MKHYPVIPWIGGKRRLANWILPKFPQHQCYVEAFAGGGALFLAKEESKVEVLNDFDGELINLYRVIQHHLEEFLRQFKWALTSRKIYEWQQLANPETLTDIQRAARFYYLQKLSFGGKVKGRTFGTATTSPPRLNLMRIEEDLSQAHVRLSRTYVEHLSWEKVFSKYDREHTLIYLDPPYWQTEGYSSEFGWENYELMNKMVRECKGMAIISINAHPDIIKLFEGLHMETKDIKYTVGCGSGSQATELLVWNDNVQRKLK
ncbi:DNA adenine methylase [Thiomicrorhabdus cannonii]|uniref:DNA adenine methylase n=1 Tax=Thiomicrorhabdus cannonii TaxID=2748011 RepID=UPI0015BBEE9D|nr:DNA adenine methylase [Thiomicrorhabdus cannonii]